MFNAVVFRNSSNYIHLVLQVVKMPRLSDNIWIGGRNEAHKCPALPPQPNPCPPTHPLRSRHPLAPTRPPAQLPRPHASSCSTSSQKPFPPGLGFSLTRPKIGGLTKIFKKNRHLAGNVTLFHEEQWRQQGGHKKKSRGGRTNLLSY